MTLLRRLRERPSPPRAGVVERLDALGFHLDAGADSAIVLRDGRAPLSLLPEVGVVEVGPEVYGSLPSRAARVALLRAVVVKARLRVDVHAPLTEGATHLGRVLLDGPRRLARALGGEVAEPGDRFVDGALRRAFFHDDHLLEEADEAGLVFVRRRGAVLELRPRGPDEAREALPALAPMIGEVLAMLPLAERARHARSTAEAVRAMRRRGARRAVRGPRAQARLRRIIDWVDALVPGGANCYRRTLLELGLDPEAARATLVFGLDVGRTGHVAFKDRASGTFDVSFEVPPTD